MVPSNIGCVFPHTLALGGAGFGKTEISKIIAKEMGVQLVEVLSQSIRSVAELNAALLQAEGGCLADLQGYADARRRGIRL
jgi:Holliday junction resolvasome RuvABC ATP-dependent DNA helicase subunit